MHRVDSVLAHRYRVVRHLGQGGMGAAYLVEDMVRGERVALKLVTTSTDAAMTAFQAEFRHLRGLVHPHLARVRDFGHADGAYYTADFIDGIDLATHAAEQPWSEVTAPLLDALSALSFLHGLKLLHGDFKPDNILVKRDNIGVLIDLSCARSFGAGAPQEGVSGTPGFIAPEVLAGKKADQRADLYAVGVTLKALCEDRDDVPKKVRSLTTRLLRADAKKRPSDVTEVVEALGGGLSLVRAPTAAPTSLLGRATEVERFEQILGTLLGGQSGPRTISIVGREGSGKTRLLEEMKWIAQQRCGVVEGQAERADAVTSMLRRASGDDDLPDDLSALFAAREQLGDRPLVMMLDDADRLDGSQLQLWEAWLRSVGDDDAVLTLQSRAVADPVAAGVVLELAPLDKSAVGAWIKGHLPKKRTKDVLRLTSGSPSSIRELLDGLSAGDWSEADLASLADRAEMSKRRRARLSALNAELLRVLATFAVMHTSLDADALDALSMSATDLSILLRDGWIRADAGGMRLWRRTDTLAILQAIDADARAALHMAVADHLERELTPDDDSRAMSAHAAAIVRHLVEGGSEQRSKTRLAQSAAARQRHPDAWVETARAIAKHMPSGELALSAAAIFEKAGRHDEAISLLARLLAGGSVDNHLIWVRAGATYLRSGNHRRAKRYLLRAREAVADGSELARVLDLLARAHIKLGDYTAAADVAKSGLALATDDEQRANLHDDLGVATSYLGDLDTAREHLGRAASLHAQLGRPREQAKAASYQALLDYRAGNTRAATEGFRGALELAERAGAADLVVYAAQNLGTACHQLGDLGRALSSYERGLTMATALGDASTEAALRCNLAKLYSDVGLLDRAADAAARAESCAEQAHLPLIAATSASVAGEVALLRGDGQIAKESFVRARAAFGDNALRELAETWIHMADAYRLLGDDDAAERAHSEARTLAGELGADDLAAKLASSEARALLQKDDPSQAIARLEEALELAKAAGQRELEAEALAWLSRACLQQGATLLADQHARAARERWERTATRLPRHLAETFWAHPARSLPRAETHVAPAIGASSDRERRLERLLDINKKLNSSLETAQILAWTIDSALDLTGAERGFVILDEDGALEISVARNIDKEATDEEHEFSRSIAQQAIADARPVITVDAQRDERFARQQSIHAMQLTSVLCVPIIAPTGVIGAVYLDHRYKRGIFGPAQVEVLSAFANQVAIALSNARLHQQLAERTRQLDALLSDQAEQIEDLAARVRVQQRALEHRFDYGNIIGESAAMQAVFRTLDRVIDSDAAVLIQGESGTGKELIAKAIHYNGARKDGPMVSINCGALPETLLESELFGYVRGAFTGATSDREGLFVSARGGTVFLDELGEMPASMQVKLLRVLQERVVTPLGTTRAIQIDVRLVAATNKRLREEVERGNFREDLYYRVGVVEIDLPPLRERTDDIPLLVDRLLTETAERTGLTKPRMGAKAMRALQAHLWPGNVRELENVITKALLLADGGTIKPASLQLSPRGKVGPRNRNEFEEAEAGRLLTLLRATGWNISQTARRLGVSRPTVYRKMERYGFDEPL